MRKFSSYGLVDKDLHFYVPRKELVETAFSRLAGENPEKGGHYITVWAPRQCGKSWIMREVLYRLRESETFDVRIFSFQSAKTLETDQGVLNFFAKKMEETFSKKFPDITSWGEIATFFRKPFFEKPVILILDEFDALQEDFINKFANEFREIYISRQVADRQDSNYCFLHGLAMIGVRSVLGIENVKGSPFNVQRSMHIPNLTYEEVCSMFRWYEEESGQKYKEYKTCDFRKCR
jgi:hypothetical protein